MSSKAPKRSLLAIGVSEYRIPNSNLPLVTKDIQKVLDTFKRSGYELESPQGVHNPTVKDAEARIRTWLRNGMYGEHDHFALYLAGHGIYEKGSNDFFLFCTDSPQTETPLPDEALSLHTIFKIFANTSTEANHLLIIIDACFSGSVANIDMPVDLSQQRGDAKKLHYIVSSTQRDPAPASSDFASALCEAITKPSQMNSGVSQQFLYMEGIVGQICETLGDRVRRSSYNVDRHTRFFLNPYFNPGNSDRPIAEQPRRERMLSDSDRIHYTAKARGVDTFSEPGNYFTGRHSALRKLVAWLQDGQPNALVVTGAPGAGKSSLLGRLVMSAETAYAKREDYLHHLPEKPPADTLPPPGSIQVAVHARNLSADQLAQAIAEGLGLPSGEVYSVDKLIAAINKESQDSCVTIVIDALDEATEARRIAKELINEFVLSKRVKVLVGSRKHLLSSEGGVLHRQCDVLDIDDAAYISQSDLAAYIKRRLAIEGSPYAAESTLTQAVANRAAADAHPNFLIARIVADTLRYRSEVINPDDYSFPKNMEQAFAGYLERFGDHEQRVRDLLLPLAYAEGAGLPSTALWLPIANMLSSDKIDHPYVLGNLTWLLREASDYIVESSESQQASRSVYRLYHQALADYLQAEYHKYALSEQAAQGRIVKALLSYVPQSSDGGYDWLDANLDPYIRNYLALHGAAAQQLTPLLQQVAFLVAAEPQALFTAMNSSEEALPASTLAVYRKSYHELVNADSQHAAEQLALTAAKYNVRELVDALNKLPIAQVLQARWASWRETPHRVLQGHTNSVTCITFCHYKGRLIAASGSDDHTVRIWDADTGQALQTLEGHTDWVRAVALAVHDQRLLLASGSDDSTVRIWDAGTGQALQTLEGHTGSVLAVALAVHGQRLLVASGSLDDTVRIWDADTGQALQTLEGHTGSVSAVALAVHGQRLLLASGSNDDTVRIWDAGSGEQLHCIDVDGGNVLSVAFAEQMLVIGTDKGIIAFSLAGL